MVKFLQQVEAIMSENLDKPMVVFAEQLQVAESTASFAVPEAIRHHFQVTDLGGTYSVQHIMCKWTVPLVDCPFRLLPKC